MNTLNNSQLFAKLGLWRTNLLWRFWGLVLFLSIRYTLNNAHTIEHVLSFPLGFLAAGFSGLVLIVFGPRLITLIIVAVCSWLAFVPIFFEGIGFQIAEEYMLFLVLPVVALLVSSVCKDRSEQDKAHVAIFRITLIVAMFFAAFHKLNHDFLNADVSCAPEIMRMLEANWRLPFPDFIVNIHPIWGIVGEMLVVILLLCRPRVGIMYALVLLGLIGHVGPVPLTLLMIGMSCSFLRDEDGILLKEGLITGLKRDGWWIFSLILCVSTFSINLYQGQVSWQIYLLFQMTFICVGYAMLQLFLQSRVQKQPLFPKLDWKSCLAVKKSARWIVLIYLCVFVFNGVSPYLGLKFRMSFAMLSNLRVDEVRWNSVLIPKWMAVFKRPTHIYVAHVAFDQKGMNTLMQEGLSPNNFMQAGLFTPMYLEYFLDMYGANDVSVDLTIQKGGKLHVYADAAKSEALLAWLGGLKRSKMFQKYLTATSPQVCYH